MDDWKAKLSGLLPEDYTPTDEDTTSASGNNVSGPVKLPCLDIILDRKRAGKTATIISGFSDDTDIKEIAQKIKQKLGTGGSARGGEILIQGDRRNDLPSILSQLGYKSRII